MPKMVVRLCFIIALGVISAFGILSGARQAYSQEPPVCTAEMNEECEYPLRSCCCGATATCVGSYTECREFCWPNEPATSGWPPL